VGPGSPHDIHLNEPAALIGDGLGLAGRPYVALRADRSAEGRGRHCRSTAWGLE
jgi:hypothetical protein